VTILPALVVAVLLILPLASNAPAQSGEGAYQEIENWYEAGISVKVSVTSFVRDALGNCRDIKGSVTEFQIGRRDSPLVSKELMITENGKTFINSLALGKILVGCGNIFFPVSLSITNTQKAKLLTLKTAAERLNAEEDRTRRETKDYKVALQSSAAKSLEMAVIQPGEFVMGSPAGETGHRDDETAHTVRITRAFELGKYKVTQGLWESVMGSRPSSDEPCLECPASRTFVATSASVSRRPRQEVSRKELPAAHGGGMGVRGESWYPIRTIRKPRCDCMVPELCTALAFRAPVSLG
jgi:hypothetical protein